jgi:hypothetical protein
VNGMDTYFNTHPVRFMFITVGAISLMIATVFAWAPPG